MVQRLFSMACLNSFFGPLKDDPMRMAMVSGAIANKPGNGGAAWTRLNWALGLKKLGFRVCFVEQIGRAHCVDAAGKVAAFDNSKNLAFFKDVVRQYGLS